MMNRIMLFLLSCVLLHSTANAGVWEKISNQFSKPFPEKNKTIKLLIHHDKPGAVLEVKGKYKIYDPNSKSHISTRFLGKRKYIQAVNDGLKWGEEFPGIYQIVIIPDQASTTLVDGIEYPGRIYIYDVGGTISIVNEVDYDDYLKSLLTSKISDSLPGEAIASMVITARTDAMYRSQNPKTNYWDIEAEIVGYQGNALNTLSGQISKTVDATHGMILTKDDPTQAPAPFAAVFGDSAKINSSKENGMISKISFEEAVEMAKRGSHAAQILKKGFPNTKITFLGN